LTEAQWVEKLSTDQTPYAESIGITLPLGTETINRNCADVIAGVKESVAGEYEKVPCIGELCRTYGDSSSGKIHEGRMKMIGVWFERYAENRENANLLRMGFPTDRKSSYKY
jgi:hypothetical protein